VLRFECAAPTFERRLVAAPVLHSTERLQRGKRQSSSIQTACFIWPVCSTLLPGQSSASALPRSPGLGIYRCLSAYVSGVCRCAVWRCICGWKLVLQVLEALHAFHLEPAHVTVDVALPVILSCSGAGRVQPMQDACYEIHGARDLKRLATR